MIFWWWNSTDGTYYHPVAHPGVFVGGNTFYQAATRDKRCLVYRNEKPRYATNLATLKIAVAEFDSTPVKTAWVTVL